MKKLLVLLFMSMSVDAMAAKYGMAGCGLGSLILGDKPGKIQIVSSLLNSWGSQTSAITTGSSNCSHSAGEVGDLRFIEENQESLKAEIAQGDGETLNGLMELWGCQKSAKSTLKQSYSEIFKQDHKAVIQISNSMKSALKNNTCEKI